MYSNISTWIWFHVDYIPCGVISFCIFFQTVTKPWLKYRIYFLIMYLIIYDCSTRIKPSNQNNRYNYHLNIQIDIRIIEQSRRNWSIQMIVFVRICWNMPCFFKWIFISIVKFIVFHRILFLLCSTFKFSCIIIQNTTTFIRKNGNIHRVHLTIFVVFPIICPCYNQSATISISFPSKHEKNLSTNFHKTYDIFYKNIRLFLHDYIQ